MGGRLWVDSEQGRGSTFHVELPFGIASGIAAPPASADFGGARLLIVDDNATNLRLIHDRATQWGLRADAADNSMAAIAAIDAAYQQGAPFAVVLVDDHMPGIDGFAVAEYIHRRPGLAGATVMMLNADDRTGDQARCRDLAISGCIVKPLTPRALLAAISSALVAAPAALTCPGSRHRVRGRHWRPSSAAGRRQQGEPAGRLRAARARRP